MKKIVLILIILILCGCSATYNLEIDGEVFNEDINVIINKSEIPNDNSLETGVEKDDPITPFLKNSNSVFFSDSSIYYTKKVDEFDDYFNVKLSYQYTSREFIDSNSLNLCFDDFEFSDEQNFYIHAKGIFYCLYGDELKINIKTNNRVIKNNADEVKGNVYTWNINVDNVDNVDIEFEATKKVDYLKYIIYIIGAMAVIGIIIFVKTIIQKNNENNKF